MPTQHYSTLSPQNTAPEHV